MAYAYEGRYEHDTRTVEHRQYRPDFTLTDAGVYLEHFGVNREGQPPADWGARACAEYVDGMAWKRALHKQTRTRLIETYSWERSEGTLLTGLARKLGAEGIPFGKVDPETLAEIVAENKNAVVDTHPLLATFLELMRSNDLSMDEVRERAGPRATDAETRAHAFLDVLEPVLAAYDAHLHREQAVDFSTMVHRAVGYVKSGRYRSPYRYLLVDEFQDMSVGRYRLLRALIDQRDDAKLFAVGDDWQSIYRFTGSDVSVIVDFEEHFGYTRQTELEDTYRFHQGIAAFTGAFVQKNPRQIRKTLRSNRAAPFKQQPFEVRWTDRRHEAEALDEVLTEIEALPGAPRRVFVLGRYRTSATPALQEIARRHQRLPVEFSTVHASKGLEADVVVLVGLRSGRYGFPSEVQDDPLFNLVLTEPETFAYSEERRLFYVAMSRAKERVYLLADSAMPSAFVTELCGDHGIEAPAPPDPCPVCQTGKMMLIDGKFGPFLGCSRYPSCRHRDTSVRRRGGPFAPPPRQRPPVEVPRAADTRPSASVPTAAPLPPRPARTTPPELRPSGDETPFDLGESGRADAVPKLRVFLRVGTSNERRLAASAIRKLSAAHREACDAAVPDLTGVLDHESPQTRQYALKALAGLTLGASAIARLSEVAEHDPKDYNRKAATEALASASRRSVSSRHG